MSLTLVDQSDPELLLLGRPLAVSDDYFAGFIFRISNHLWHEYPVPTVSTTPLNPDRSQQISWPARPIVLNGNLRSGRDQAEAAPHEPMCSQSLMSH